MRLDFFWALRSLRKNPFFASTIILILAVGIGANTAVFSIVDAVLLRPSQYEHPERLVRVEESTTTRTLSGVPAHDYDRWAGRTDVFERVARYLRDTVTLTGDGDPEQVIAVRSTGLFPLLGVSAQLGRTLIPSDDEAGTRNVAVISDRLWQRRYNRDHGIVGRQTTISDEAYTIVGVMPPEFEFRYPEAELWTPLRYTPTTPWLQVAARLRAGVAVSQAQTALDIVASQMEQEAPKERARFKISVAPWNDLPDQKYKLTLVFALAAAGLVVLLACTDVGGLLLSRAVQRQKEIAIRTSLGAGLPQIARQLMIESVLLAVLGSLSGIAVARWVLHVLLKHLAALPIVLPHLQGIALNGRVLLFDAASCLLVALLCSVAPFLLAVRTDSQAVLRSGQAPARARESSRLFSTLIAFQAGLAILLLVGSGLMIRSLIRLQQEDHGFRPDHVLTLRVPVGTFTQPRPAGKYDTKARQMAYYREILERIRTVRGINAAAIVNNLPLSGVNSSLIFNFRAREGESQLTSARTISSQYFAAMGIALIAGRDFTDSDRTGAAPVAIINEYLARQLFPDRNPLGEKLTIESKDPGPTIVGVVKDSSQMSYELPAKGEVYVPYQQFIFATFMSTIVVRTEGEPAALAAALRQQVWAVDRNQPIVKVETMDQVIANATWRPRFAAWMSSVLSGLCVFLTALGVYGIVAYTATLRAREVGIRVALGATSKDVLAVILRGAMIPLAIGAGAGIASALILSNLISSLLHGIAGSDPLAYVSAAALLLTIGLAASARPAWKASTRDPLETLRAE